GGVIAKSRGPGGVVRDALFGAETHVSVDEGSASQAAAKHYVDIGIHAEVEQAGGGSEVRAGNVGLKFHGGFFGGVGVFAGLDFAAALQQADLAAGARHAGSGDGPAVAGADDHYLITIFHLFDG